MTTGEEKVDSVNVSVVQHVIHGLCPFTTYGVSLQVYNAAGDGPRSNVVNVTTQESAPDPPENLHFTDVLLTQVTVSWSKPYRINGILQRYEVSYQPLMSTGRKARKKTVGPEENSTLVVGLEESVVYVFGVRAQSGRGWGNATVGNVTTGPQIGSPGQPIGLMIDLAHASADLRWVSSVLGSFRECLRDNRLFYFCFFGTGRVLICSFCTDKLHLQFTSKVFLILEKLTF